MPSPLETLTWIAFALAMILSPISWFRMIRAKTRFDYVKNGALFLGPLLLAWFLVNAAGLVPEHVTPAATPPSVQYVFDMVPKSQIILLALAGAVWIGGGNLLMYFHNRRIGKRWWQSLNPLTPPFKDFNAAEWSVLVALIVVSLVLVTLGISIGESA
jgi:hypothetical protein